MLLQQQQQKINTNINNNNVNCVGLAMSDLISRQYTLSNVMNVCHFFINILLKNMYVYIFF